VVAGLALEERDQQVDGRADVLGVRGLRHGVEVSGGDGDGADRLGAVGVLEAGGVGPAGREHLQLVGELLRFGDLAEPPVDLPVGDDAGVLQLDRGAVAERRHGVGVFLDLRDVVGDCHVQRDRQVRVDVDAQRRRAAEADLLLDGRREVDRHRRALDLAGRLQHRKQADPVVEGFPGDAVAEPLGGLVHRDEVADGDELRDRLGVPAEVDGDVPDLVVLLDLLFVERVRRDRPDDAGHVAVVGVDRHALGAEHARVPAAERVDHDEPVVGDVPDHEPDLVHVGRDGHRIVALALDRADDVAHRVRPDAVDAVGELLADQFAHAVLVAGDARRLGQLP